MLSAFLFRLRAIFQRNSVEAELDEELRSHFEHHLEKLVASGLTREEAARRARLEFGGHEQLKEECRDAHGMRIFETVTQDVGYGLRMLRKNPGFATVAVLTLAIGIGANTAIYSVVNAVLFRPLPIREPDRVVVLHDQFPFWGVPRTKVSPLQFLEFSQRTDLFESSGAVKLTNLNLTSRGQAVRLQVMETTAGLFPTLGVEPTLGRGFTTNDGIAGSTHVTVLSHRLWHRLFSDNRHAMGEGLRLDGQEYEIVGVLPESLETMYPDVDAWIPAIFSPEYLNEAHRFYVDYSMIARLRQNMSVPKAQAAMKTIVNRFEGEEFKFSVELRPILDDEVGEVRGALYILWGAVGLVLCIACSNIANLLLARNVGRSREIAVRGALGASRIRLMTQLLTENLLLSSFGGVSGLLLAYVFLSWLRRMAPADLPHIDAIRLDVPVLLVTFLVTFIAALLFDIVPSALSARGELARTLKEGGRGAGTSRRGQKLRAILVTSEIALSLVLLAGSGLLLRSFQKLLDVQPGFDTENLLALRVSVPSSIYGNSKQLPVFSSSLLERISAVPGVLHASIATGIPFASDGDNGTFEIRNRQDQPNEPSPHAIAMYVTTDYFATMRIPLLKGRFFLPADLRYGHWLDKGAVRIIDEALARRFWPNGDPIGAQIGNDGQWATIVGVVRSVHDRDLAAEPEGTIYYPGYGGTTLAVRTVSDPRKLAAVIDQQVRSIDENLPTYDVTTMKDLVAASLARRRFATTQLTIFALLSFVLALVGLYGAIAYLVTERVPEIGIRLALGAQQRDVLGLMLTQGLQMAVLGVALGLLGFLLVRPLVASQLFGVGPADLFTLVAVSVLLLSTAAAATFIPARRATRVDPMVTLRYE